MLIRVKALAGVLLGLSSGACAAIYPELSAPIGQPPNEDAIKPEPPDDYAYVYFKDARMPTSTRDGRAWGKGKDSLPSPYAIVFLDGTEITRTEIEQNTLEPTWPNQKKANYLVGDKSRLKVEIWDDHGLFPRPICQKELHNLANYIEVGEAEVDCPGGASFTLAVEPAHALWGLGFYYEFRTSSVVISRVVAASTAGRVGLKPGDQIIAIMGKRTSQLDNGEVQTLIRVNASTGLKLKVRTGEGPIRRLTIKEQAMYPLAGEKVEAEEGK